MKTFGRYASVLAVGVLLGVATSNLDWTHKQYPLIRAFPVDGAYNTEFGSHSCVDATPHELRVYESALDAIQTARPVLGHSKFVSGARSVLINGFFREVEDQRPQRVCSPPGLYNRLKPLVQDSLLRYSMQYEDLKLASKLPDPDPELVETIARVAFSETPHVENTDLSFSGRDLRPFARSVLASMRPPRGDILSMAKETMHNQDPLGTASAQVAASYRDPNVLADIEALMLTLLHDIPSNKPIGSETRDRLYELGFALALAGADASPYTSALNDLMSRKVESHSMFGILGLSPKRMCGALKAIDGEDVANTYEYCLDPDYPLAQ